MEQHDSCQPPATDHCLRHDYRPAPPTHGKVVWLSVLVLEVEGVLPHVDAEERDHGEQGILVGSGS